MAGFLPDSFIQRVLDETDVVSLIDSYIPLQKKGKDHWSLCPFCEDGNNPSFSVSSQKQFYYCFRCRASRCSASKTIIKLFLRTYAKRWIISVFTKWT